MQSFKSMGLFPAEAEVVEVEHERLKRHCDEQHEGSDFSGWTIDAGSAQPSTSVQIREIFRQLIGITHYTKKIRIDDSMRGSVLMAPRLDRPERKHARRDRYRLSASFTSAKTSTGSRSRRWWASGFRQPR